MHKKLLLFVGLVVGVTFASSLLQSSPSFAAGGETYQWTSATTIQGSGGKYKGKTTFSVTPDKKFSGSVTELISTNINVDVIYGACNNTTGRIVISDTNRKTGTFWIGDLAAGTTTGCGSHPVSDVDMLDSFSIVAQATTGESDAAWKAKNCNTLTNANEKTRCTAIKACVADKGKPAADCEAAWTSCMAPDQSAAAYTACAKQVAAGNTTDAKFTPEKSDEDENKSSCRIEGVGWIICPVMRVMAQITDGAYTVVSFLLKTPPISTDTSSPTYKAWSIVRNFANIAFVIAFLVVIYSQITGVGLSNYSVKKMLPRIILAAILVNVSYWICAIAVDVTNIVGTSISGLLEGTAKQLYTDKGGFESGAGGAWDVITAGLLGTVATAAILYAGLSILLPMLIAALATVVTLVVILTIRQALIIIFIVISPLAFVAFLLPNTEPWFKKWKSIFQLLLVMFPIIAVMFGGCALASTVISESAGTNFALQVMGAGVTIVPLFLAPFIIKTVNGGLSRLGLSVNNPDRGLFDRAKKGAQGFRDYRQNVRGGKALSGVGKMIGSGQFKRSYRRDLRNQAADSAAKSGQAQFGTTDKKAASYVAANTASQAQMNAINAANSSRFVGAVATSPGLVSSGMGKAADDKEVNKALGAQQERAIADAIRDVELTTTFNPGDVKAMGDKLASAVSSGDSITARAMQNMLLKSGGAGTEQYRKTMETIPADQMGTETVNDMKRNLLTNHSGVKETAYDLMKHAASASGTTMSQVSNDASTWSGLSDEDLVKQKSHSLIRAKAVGGISQAQAQNIKDDPQLYRKLDEKGREVIDSLAP